jgi:mono/diheme cytochrome c family protein/glucose/arabinose dehydrogenase
MKKLQYPFVILAISSLLFYCKTNKQVQTSQNSTTSSPATAKEEVIDFSKSPFVSPEASISKMTVQEGFEVKLVAAEPLISAPVAMLHDDKARMWVVEMVGYMPDTTGAGEDVPNGKIVILEDKNKDGIYDNRKVFLDSLVLPRAICLIDGGILVAEPANLWFYEISNDKPVNKQLVDDKYAVGGNVEHQPNGLLRAMDNWIYNSKSDKRYRKIDGKWVVERTHFRGQWGITQDNYGRLYYNNNSQNLLGDYFSPGFGAMNKNQRGVAGYNEKSVANNKVYPIRPTPGVNRGYMKNVLNDSLKLNEFTAAAGPVVYRGDLFGKDYEWNAFTPEPSANLIKRNILNESGYVTKGEQAYKGKEFLASTDERFRPVNLYNAPDGSMFVLDMYRGIIQHKTYLTPYLAGQIGQRDLTQPLASGRIYKIVPKNKKADMVTLSDNPEQLVKLLSHANGWVRDKAQQKLIDKKSTQIIPLLRSAVQQKENTLFAIHALWTLEGLGALQTDEVLGLLNSPNWTLRMEALTSVPSVISKDNFQKITAALDQLLTRNDTLAAPYVAFLAPQVKKFDAKLATNLLTKVAVAYPQNRFVADAVISNLQDDEEDFQKTLMASLKGTDFTLTKQLQKAIANAKSAAANRNPEILKKQYPKGEALFTSICQTCHGIDGNGVKSLGPPLNQSEWVTGSHERLISVVLFGLTGPVKVNGHVYEAPEISGDMPGIGYDKDMPSEDIAQLLSYIRKSWRNNADNVGTEEVVKLRQKLSGRQKAFTEAELNGLRN